MSDTDKGELPCLPSMASLWDRWTRCGLPNDLDSERLAQLRDCFMAGAVGVFLSIDHAGDAHSEAEFLALMQRYGGEAKGFEQECKVKDIGRGFPASRVAALMVRLGAEQKADLLRMVAKTIFGDEVPDTVRDDIARAEAEAAKSKGPLQ